MIGRTALPSPADWLAAGEDLSRSVEQRTLLARLARMHAERDDVLVLNADMNDPAQLRTAVDGAFARFGRWATPSICRWPTAPATR